MFGFVEEPLDERTSPVQTKSGPANAIGDSSSDCTEALILGKFPRDRYIYKNTTQVAIKPSLGEHRNVEAVFKRQRRRRASAPFGGHQSSDGSKPCNDEYMPALAQTELAPVQVRGNGTSDYTAANSSLTKLPEPMLNTPISVTTVTQQLMSDRGDTNLNDALRNVPSITLQSNESSWMGNAPFIRGFSARTDMFLDGMRDIGMYYRDPFNLNQVEVLEGPDSILFGRGSTGGVVEQDSKTPQLEQFISASASGGTNSLGRAVGDVNIPIEGLGTPAALRANVMVNTNGVADRDVVRFNRYGLAPSLALGLGTPTRTMTVSYFYPGRERHSRFWRSLGISGRNAVACPAQQLLRL